MREVRSHCVFKMPFGEELYAGTGGRTTAQGYSAGDGVRQQFTGYERDGETGLDYAKARYFGNSLGRFSSADPLMASGKPWIPQSWNRYTYCLNNPLKFSDPTGLIWVYHWLNKDHTQIGFGWVNSSKEIPKGYQALPFSGSGVKILTLAGGHQLAILRSNSGIAQIVSGVRSSSEQQASANMPLLRELGRQTEPMPKAIAAFAGASVVGGGAVAGSALALPNAIAYALLAAHERSHDDAQIAASTRISMDDAINKAVDHVGTDGIVETTKAGNFQFRSTGINANGQVESRMGRFDINPADPDVLKQGPHLNIETHINGAQTQNLHFPIDPVTIRPGDIP